MRIKLIAVIFLALLLTVLPLRWTTTLAQDQPPQRFFPETGHTVSGEFLLKYESIPDPILIYGYPITEAFIDAVSGHLVQYFQRARFELIPEASEGQRVQLTPLGLAFYQPGVGRELPLPIDFSACRFFTQTERRSCYSFLQFFDKYGGPKQFGYPISNIELDNNRIVQYFQFARFEWHPEYPAGQQIVISDLGMLHFKRAGLPMTLLQPPKTPPAASFIPERVLNLKVNAFVARGKERLTRTLFVIVQDQNRQPLEGISIDFIVRLPDGSQKSFIMPQPTNIHGFSSMTFSIDQFPLNRLVEIIIHVSHNGLETETRTAFWTWY